MIMARVAGAGPEHAGGGCQTGAHRTGRADAGRGQVAGARADAARGGGRGRSLWVVEVQQISVGHPAVRDVLAIQRNTAPNRFGLAVTDGLWAVKLALQLDLRIDTFFFCPELVRSRDATAR